jgi:hydroxymethylglutaryl-CoA lyase
VKLFDLKSLPSKVSVYEVGPRDGLQNETIILPTKIKLELIKKLIAAGLPAVEVTSMVPANLLPTLSDADQLLAELSDLLPHHRLPVLVPNQKGLERALTADVREIAVFASATESFSQANLNRSIKDSRSVFDLVIREAKSEGLKVRGYISMCFGDPWEGPVSTEQVSIVAQSLFESGVDELSLGDTIGVATAKQVVELLDQLSKDGMDRQFLAVHFHDTYGQALSNTLVALSEGITTVDSSIAGLGGCPFAKSATGNLATEDLVWQLNGLGIETGIDLPALIKAGVWLAKSTGLKIRSKTAIALSGLQDVGEEEK